MKKKLFVISSRVPYPLDKGDKLRLYHQLKHLSKDFEIMLVSLDENGDSKIAEGKLASFIDHVHILQLSKLKIYVNLLLGFLGRKPFQVYYFYQRKSHKKIKSLIDSFQPDYIYSQLLRSAEYVKDYHHIPKTIDYQDAFSKGIERRLNQEGWKKPIFELEHKRLLKYENIIFDYFEHHTIISDEDRNAIFHEKRNTIDIIPNGVDTVYFSADTNIDKKYDLLFVGNMSYAPNIDAAKYIAHQILPSLLKKHPSIKILIAGSNPTTEVRKLENENLSVSGWMEDIRVAYNESSIFLAPMQLGSGLQNKLLEAMSMNLPCITSKLANKSLNASNNVHAIVCESLKEYVSAIDEIITNKEKAKNLSENARQFVFDNFSWENSVKKLTATIQS